MITDLYILICLVIFIYIQFISKEDKISSAMKLGAFYPPYIQEFHQYYRFLTCHFIHIDFIHFIMNAYALYQLGHFFEWLLLPGPYLFLVVISMLLSAMLCFSVSQISERSQRTLTFGASGVVYGFFGAIVALMYFRGNIYADVFQEMMPIIAINFIYTIIYPGISKAGHVGGFIGGIAGTIVLLALHIIL